MDATISPMLRLAVALSAVLAVALAGCGFDASGQDAVVSKKPPRGARQKRSSKPTSPRPAAPRARVRRARCPAGVDDCVAVTGRVIYVEAVDPDGDGDAHYVLAGGDVTAPGLTIIDVARERRPRRLPRRGDVVSAAGSIETGSHHQKQISAAVLHYQRG
jgi:hypothetical protein